LLAELGIESLEKWLIKVLDSMGFLEFDEEAGAVYAIENSRGPVENFGEVQVFELAWVGNFVEELAENRDTEEVRG
jgi:hypothetical protein